LFIVHIPANSTSFVYDLKRAEFSQQMHCQIPIKVNNWNEYNECTNPILPSSAIQSAIQETKENIKQTSLFFDQQIPTTKERMSLNFTDTNIQKLEENLRNTRSPTEFKSSDKASPEETKTTEKESLLSPPNEKRGGSMSPLFVEKQSSIKSLGILESSKGMLEQLSWQISFRTGEIESIGNADFRIALEISFNNGLKIEEQKRKSDELNFKGKDYASEICISFIILE